ncbi:DNA methylase N-4/N-6, partial [Rodentibacter genomosp. 2]
MTILNWYGKEEAVKKAKKVAYRLLREVPEFSHNLVDNRQST